MGLFYEYKSSHQIDTIVTLSPFFRNAKLFTEDTNLRGPNKTSHQKMTLRGRDFFKCGQFASVLAQASAMIG
jgi:hypothetical protein